jgi:hypothetical protein
LLGHLVNLCLTSETAKLCPKVATQFYIHTSIVQNFHFFEFQIVSILVKQYIIVSFICISLLTNDTEHLFMSILIIWISSLQKCLFKFFTHF